MTLSRTLSHPIPRSHHLKDCTKVCHTLPGGMCLGDCCVGVWNQIRIICSSLFNQSYLNNCLKVLDWFDFILQNDNLLNTYLQCVALRYIRQKNHIIFKGVCTLTPITYQPGTSICKFPFQCLFILVRDVNFSITVITSLEPLFILCLKPLVALWRSHPSQVCVNNEM